MKVQMLAIDALHVDPANARRHPARNLDAVKASLARFGQQKPVVVDANGVVRAGNATLEAARALGWEKVAAVRTGLASVEATAYAIADNRTGELAEWDDDALAKQLRALRDDAVDLAAIGFTDDELDLMLETLIGDPIDDLEGEWSGMPACDNGANPIHRILKVFFRSDEDVAAFARLVEQIIGPETADIWYPRLVMNHPARDPYVDIDGT